MRITVKVIPRSSRICVEEKGDNLKVRLTRPAVDGEANRQLIEVLADYLGKKKSALKIVGGHNSRIKVISVDD